VELGRGCSESFITSGTNTGTNGPHLSNPVAATDENLLAGMKIFRDACAGCHGDPSATSDYGASFYPHVLQFAKKDWVNEHNAFG
jgi:hypothetical protein